MASSSGDLTNGGGGGGGGGYMVHSGSGATASAPTTTTTTKTKPLTMFYNGGVAVFHLPQDKAEVVMNMAAGEDGRDDDGGRQRRPNHGDELLAKLRQDTMPTASKRSLQRFFQKRKERLYGP
ncbi:protein TIFY 9-like [Miscanthus floridulus]|uniref:protein TIFY 9-like n=1 Tax=Miscanthus floridulus TaxID=154761 RepID=UPI00345A9570